MNINSLPTHGTLEFRQHSGTLNAAKVLHWTRFTRLFMDLREHGVPDVMEDTGKYAEIHTIEEVIRNTKDEEAAAIAMSGGGGPNIAGTSDTDALSEGVR